MDLRSLSDDVLIVHTKESVRVEREATTTVLHHLREVERRMLFAKLGFSSLIEYAIKELKYSESAAYRRLSAMRLLKELPEIEQKIQTGGLSLAAVAQAQTHFRQTKTATVEEKKEVLQELENLSARACERVLAEKRGETEPPERQKPLADGKTQITFVLDDETEVLLKEVQVELGRTLEMKALVKEMAKLSLQVLRKRKSSSQASRSPKGENSSVEPSVSKASGTEAESATPASVAQSNNISLHNETVGAHSQDGFSDNDANSDILTDVVSSIFNDSSKSRRSNDQACSDRRDTNANADTIPLPTRRAVWRRDTGRCQYRDPLTGRQCECTTYLQIEHIVPRAHGGSNELENLELLCRAHNAYRAVRVFGPKHMKQFVTSLR